MSRTPLDDIPAAPGALPLIGHLAQLLRDPLGLITGLPAYGDLVRLRFGPVTLVVVCNLEPTLQVLRDDRTFDKGGLLYDRAREVLGNGLVTCPHADHRRQRRELQPAFSAEHLRAFAPIMTAHAAEAAGRWRDGQVIEVNPEMNQLTARIIADVVFSDALPPEALRLALDDVDTVIRGVFRRLASPPQLDRVPTPANRRYRHAGTRLRATLGEVVAERRAAATAATAVGAGRADVFSAVLGPAEHEAGEGSPLTDAETIDQAVSLFVAGTETTAGALSWALYALGRHPRIAEQVRAEADRVLGGRAGTHADLPELRITGQVITECLRCWPAAGWLLTRTVTRDTRLGGHELPAGTMIAYSPYLIHHRADLYPDPDRFSPDRWDAANRPRREAFIPFGWGARRCIGDQFGFAEAVLVLATLVARRRFETVPGPVIRPAVTAGFTPRGLRMRVAELRS